MNRDSNKDPRSWSAARVKRVSAHDDPLVATDDEQDVLSMRRARAVSAGKPALSLGEVKRRYCMTGAKKRGSRKASLTKKRTKRAA